jgi:hypothetical protein
MNDYLWNRSGEADAEIERLERLLSRYRYEGPLRSKVIPFRTVPQRWLAACAALVIFSLISVAAATALRLWWQPERPWTVLATEGVVTIDGRAVGGRSSFGTGEVLRTAAASSARIRVARIGEITVGPSSVVRLEWTASRRHRIALETGSVFARIWAPPFAFGVHTPAGLASDLGCEFTLHYGETGRYIDVTSGWVDFDGRRWSSAIPEGARAELREEGPGTPYYRDAPEPFVDAVRNYDLTRNAEALERVLVLARTRDAMTLIHILERAPSDEHSALFQRLTELAPPPSGVTRETVLARDREAFNAWREAIGLRSYKKWWLNWKDALPR